MSSSSGVYVVPDGAHISSCSGDKGLRKTTERGERVEEAKGLNLRMDMVDKKQNDHDSSGALKCHAFMRVHCPNWQLEYLSTSPTEYNLKRSTHKHKTNNTHITANNPSNQIRRIPHLLQPHKILLDTPRTHKPIKDTHTPRLVVRPTPARPAEGLLPHHGARALVVVVYVAGGVAEAVGSGEEGLTVCSEAVGCWCQSQCWWWVESKWETYMAPVRAYSVVLSIKSSVFS
jgi:hypothetical protein